ncbi:MAG TPA: hypothetical protein VHE34_10745 [Puia sp.]|uniref:hypothetical protein n=1 Tax=Puia sp. TaxID=2045100 RepID=UPI002CAFC887|nr:hypothetical protein [Puia sp.]HVU95694.1 hypothetical protein [Puia sp.]
MSINNIVLSDLLVRELYGNTALVPPTNPPVAAKPAPIPSQPASAAPAEPQGYKFLGKNNRGIAIIVDTPGAAFLPDPQLEFLTKILEACRMNIGDVAIVNHHTAPVAIAALRQQLQPQNVLLFGIEPTAIRLPINFPEFKIQPYDQCTYLSAPPLQQLVANTPDAKLLKSKLWVCLKTLFDV